MRELPPTGAPEREVVQAINQLVRGRSNAVGSLTLTPNAATTSLTGELINANSFLFLAPRTANAAAALATTHQTVVAGQITISHANNAQTDRTFGYVILGG